MSRHRQQLAPVGGRRRSVRQLLVCGLWLMFAGLELTGHAQMSMTNSYQVSRYELRGNTALSPEVADQVLANAVGPAVPLGAICRSLAALRKAYQTRGYLHVQVSLPDQKLAGGIVLVNVVQGDLSADVAPVPAPPKAAPAPMKFAVQSFAVTGNTLLPPATITAILQSATGPSVTLDEIRRAAVSLQSAYRERGYASVAVSLPAQRLTNAIVHLVVTEGRLASVKVVSNRHFSDANVLRAFPDIRTNTLLNSHVFQAELDAANQNRDRQIYPTLGPGPAPGSSALVLRVQDRLPLHVHLEADNYSTPNTPDLRVNFAAQYNNLWQDEQQLGVAYAFTPQAFKPPGSAVDFGLNQPLVSSYSLFYRWPFSAHRSLADSVAASPRFGYQEATHQFLLPPAQAAAELTVYASASASDTGVQWGKPVVFSTASDLTEVSQDSQESAVDNENIGAQFRFPLESTAHARLAGFAGVDFKAVALSGNSTNNFNYTTYSYPISGTQTNVAPGAYGQPHTEAAAVYFPINGGLDFSASDPQGSTAANLTLTGNLLGHGLDKVAYSTRGYTVYGKAVLTASREENLPAGYSLVVRGSSQAASGALIGNEQFAVGGVSSVRGYYEGDQYGDCGWTGTLEMRTPYWAMQFQELSQSVPAWLRASVFSDCGQRFLLEPSSDAESTLWLWGAGVGLSANIDNHWDARLNLAVPLATTPNTPRGDWRAIFSIGGQF